jgi:predicted amidohydrolase YtcJ
MMHRLTVVLTLLALLTGCQSGDSSDIADTIYKNGKIYTVNEDQPWAEAVAIRDGRFIVVGSNADVEKVTAENTKVIDLNGAFVMPGVQENHVHASCAGATIEKYTGRLEIPRTATPKEIQRMIVEYAEANPGDGWIRGQTWGTAHFEDGRARKDFIDEVMPHRPVILLDESVHLAVANSKALEMAGITKDTPQPVGGVIEKDPKTGEPTGFLADWGMFPVLKINPRVTPEQWRKAIVESRDLLHVYGVTAYTDAICNREAMQAYKDLDLEEALKMRVECNIMMTDYQADVIEPWKIIEDREQFRSRLFDPSRAKWGADGIPLSGSSIMLEPYANDPNNYGIMGVEENEFEKFADVLEKGMQLMVHTIGDGTTRKVLDYVAKARAANPENQRPVQFAHPIWTHPDDIKRMAELNVVAEVSPPMYFWNGLLKSHVPVLGEERVLKAMPIREYLDAGVLVTYGSDWPAGTSSANPWPLMEGMVTRLNPYGESPGEQLGETISLEEAIKIFTINGATAMENEEVTGSIEVGKYADMIILDMNPFNLVRTNQTDRIGDIKVTRTIFEGEVVFDREASIDALEVVDIEITNKDLDKAVDAAELNLLIEDDLHYDANGRCFHVDDVKTIPGHSKAPTNVNEAFAALVDKGYEFVRPAREILWKKDNSKYWIQWTLKDDTAVLWAYDPEVNETVEVLRVKEK